jgi:hypothetical protein
VAEPNVSALARKWRVDIDSNPADPGETWVQIKGVSEYKDSINPNLEDDSVYDDEGWGGQTKTALAQQIEIKIIRRHDPSDETSYDPGQELVRAAAREFGADGQVHLRWYDRFGGPEAYDGWFEVQWVPDGGPHTALETVVVTFFGKGKPTAISNPNAASS